MTSHAPRTVGRYVVDAEIGRGGMGVVYRGRDPELGRDVAIKALRAGSEEAGRAAVVTRVRREARLLAALNHTGIAQIYDIVETEAGPWLVLEFVRGESLAERLNRGALPIDEALPLCLGIARALEAAHARGVIHRDLKPANVMLSRDGAIKIVDFGIGRLLTPDETAGLDTTIAAPVVSGTPAYMSPEQMRAVDEDEHTDVWGFGCVLYECLTARRTRDRELGSLPSETPPAIRSLIEECLRDDPHARPPDMSHVRDIVERAAAARSAHAAARGNLPLEVSLFAGRETEITEVASLLEEERLVTLVGVGGVGKTRLALAVAGGCAPRFGSGVWFVDLSTISEPALVVSLIAQSVGVRERTGEPLLETLLQAIRSRQMLLVLDNCEHLLAPLADVVHRILREAGHVHLLATSREPLGMSGEAVYAVGPLSEEDGIALFRARARVTEGPEDDAAARDICRQLDGLPLAIELAAARTSVLTGRQIAERLHDRFRFLTRGGSRSVARHHTLRAALDWSYELLDPAERAALERLSVFTAGWTLGAAEAVVPDDADARADVLDLIDRLVAKSLVVAERDARGMRYRLIETVRQYAHERLAHAPVCATRVADRHLQYYRGLAEEGVSRRRGTDHRAWLAATDAENGNTRSAFEWAIACGDADSALRLCAANGGYWEDRGRFTEGRRAIERALRLVIPDAPSPAVTDCLAIAGRLAQLQGDYAEAQDLLTDALSRAEQTQDKNTMATVLNVLGLIEADRGRFDDARACYERALSLRREAGDDLSLASVMNNLGLLARARGDADEAQRHMEDALQCRRRIGDVVGVAQTLTNLAVIANQRGDFASARALNTEAIGIRRLHEDTLGVATLLGNLGLITLAEGDAAVARTLLEESLALSTGLGNRWGVGAAVLNSGHVALEEGDTLNAAHNYRQATALFREMQSRRPLIECVESAGRLAVVAGDPANGVRLLATAVSLRRPVETHIDYFNRVRIETALAHAREALGEAAFASAWSEGEAMPLDAAVDLALRTLSRD